MKKSEKPPKVLLSLCMANAAGRQRMIGVMRFLAQTVRWDIRIVQPTTVLSEAEVAQAVVENFNGIINALSYSDAVRRQLANADMPVVHMEAERPSLPGGRTSVICIDNSDIARQAADYFLNLGNFSEYAFAPAPGNPSWSRQR